MVQVATVAWLQSLTWELPHAEDPTKKKRKEKRLLQQKLKEHCGLPFTSIHSSSIFYPLPVSCVCFQKLYVLVHVQGSQCEKDNFFRCAVLRVMYTKSKISYSKCKIKNLNGKIFCLSVNDGSMFFLLTYTRASCNRWYLKSQ